MRRKNAYCISKPPLIASAASIRPPQRSTGRRSSQVGSSEIAHVVYLYAISTPIEDQLPSDGVAGRGPAFGMTAGRVDGNDVIAVFEEVNFNRGQIVAEHVPVLLELKTYRRGHHSTSDDSSRTGHLDASGCRSDFPYEEHFGRFCRIAKLLTTSTRRKRKSVRTLGERCLRPKNPPRKRNALVGNKCWRMCVRTFHGL